jgi:hypothetical protein
MDVDAPFNMLDANQDCVAPATVCVHGQVQSFTDAPLNPEPTASSGLVVRIYDQVAFFADPATAPPLATLDIGLQGAFSSPPIPRPPSQLLAIVTDDELAANDRYVPTAVIFPLHPGQEAGGTAFYVESTIVDGWQSQIGVPPGCTSSLRACGLWIGAYVDVNDNPVGNVRPSRPGDDPSLANVFCFEGGRAFLSTADVTTADLGACAITPDAVENHTGVCGTGGCTCTVSNCSLNFPLVITGGAAGVVVVETFRGG